MKTYIIIRKYFNMNHLNHNKVIKTGLSLEQAQEHCSDKDTQETGVWMDVFNEE